MKTRLSIETDPQAVVELNREAVRRFLSSEDENLEHILERNEEEATAECEAILEYI